MSFPANWPASCPPSDAIDADGIVYRVVKSDPPNAADFITHFESGRMLNAPACMRCGLSVFRSLQDAIHQKLLIPKLGNHVAKRMLVAADGKTKATSGQMPTHTTWWVHDGVDRCAAFVVTKESS